MQLEPLKAICQLYYLAGQNPQAIWTMADGRLSVRFLNDTKTWGGRVEGPLADFPEGQFAVATTEQWIKIFDVLKGDCVASLDGPDLLLQTDRHHARLRCAEPRALADPKPAIDAIEKKYSGSCLLNSDFIANFAKSVAALKTDSEADTVHWQLDAMGLSTTVGSYTQLGFLENVESDSDPIDGHYKLKILNDIFRLNKSAKTLELSLREDGCRLVFSHADDLTATYVLARTTT